LESRQFKDIDEYIALASAAVQPLLKELRRVIREAAPGAEEDIRYQMPTFRLKGKNLVHFAAFKSHIGFYPTPSGVEAYRNELEHYRFAKGSIRFPLDEPLPFDLVRKIVRSRVSEVLGKATK
jgi:uncharacterized protein YdhG (YjbR/CyaY superfamily)